MTRTDQRAEAPGDAAPRHADVHQLRLVLRRDLRHRDGPGHPVCRQGPAAGGGPAGARIWKKVFWRSSAQAKSNIPEHDNGARIYEKFVKPAQVDLTKVAVHFAFSSLFKEYDGADQNFLLHGRDGRLTSGWRMRHALPPGASPSPRRSPGKHAELMFCVVRFGRHDFKGESVTCR